MTGLTLPARRPLSPTIQSGEVTFTAPFPHGRDDATWLATGRGTVSTAACLCVVPTVPRARTDQPDPSMGDRPVAPDVQPDPETGPDTFDQPPPPPVDPAVLAELARIRARLDSTRGGWRKRREG